MAMTQQPRGQSVVAAWRAAGVALALACVAQLGSTEELCRDRSTTGQPGGWLQTAQRTEVRTFNPVIAVDTPSRDVIGHMHSDLIHINRRSLQPEPALASSWSVSPDRRIYTLNLRRGIRFSDGHPMDADDVVFTFRVYLDENTRSTQRHLLIVHGKPVTIRKTGTHTVQFELAAPYASAERLFDRVPILPRHLLLRAYREGTIARAWGIGTPPDQIAGLGPFRLKAFVPGERVVLERNPWYWKADRDGRRLPYLEGLVFHFLPSEEVHTVRFLAGDLSVVDRLGTANFLEIRKRQESRSVRVYDAGPGLEYQFLLFNMNDAPAGADRDVALRRKWFGDLSFRQAVSFAIDREAISRLVYSGLADPIWGHVTPGNTLWRNEDIPRPARSIEHARSLLRRASFSWQDDRLVDAEGNAVEFSILVSSSNAQRGKAATVVQHDLKQLGMKVSVVSLESRTMLDRVFNRREYDAAVMAIDSADLDPNSEMNVWLSGGSMHLWNLSGKARAGWEQEIDQLMRRQMTMPDRRQRKSAYDRVQQLAFHNLPFICLTSPHVLVGASASLGNFEPSILRPNALWNAESLYFRESR
jgi:peptide/nickel transport system substrate-binding protein